MRKLVVLLLAALLLLITGCTMNSARMERSAMNASVQLDKSQYEVVGDISGSAEVTQILFFVDGVKPNYGQLMFGYPSYSSVEAMAVYDAIENSKGADSIIAPRFKTKSTMFFPFYSKTSVTVTGKGIKLK